MYAKYVKRMIDFVLALCGLLLLWPLLLVLAVCVKLSSPGPVLFKQKRVGANKTYFNMPKFRSMRTDAPSDVPTHLLADPLQHITPIGRFLRKTSLDELPQLWSIFTGKMSVVGPRPALWNQEDLIAERERYGANALRPGLTGWAQINGRDELPVPEKARLDGEYAEKISFLFDAKCFFGTIGKVLGQKGVAEGGPKSPEKDG